MVGFVNPITTIEGRKSDIELHEALDIAIAALRNNWISVKDRLPEEHKVVLCIVNGKPETNITLRNAYQLGSWNKTEGWIIEEYLYGKTLLFHGGSRFQNRLRRISYEKKCEPGDPKPL